jgi:hypothetical protein
MGNQRFHELEAFLFYQVLGTSAPQTKRQSGRIRPTSTAAQRALLGRQVSQDVAEGGGGGVKKRTDVHRLRTHEGSFPDPLNICGASAPPEARTWP